MKFNFPKVSIIIRTKDEKQRIAELLGMIRWQDYKGQIEIIAVDTNSTDGTRDILKQFNVNTISISQEEFSYPKSMNLGMGAASGELVIITVGHALPFRKDWISSGVRHFLDLSVAGVFGPTRARRDCTWAEFFFYNWRYYLTKIKGVQIADPKKWPGIMGATNCMLRRSLWKEHQFDENFGAGGEDVEWANWAIKQGYKIMVDPKFSVRHSHGNNLFQLKKQRVYWKKLGKPMPFDRKSLSFRKDLR